MRLKRGRVFNGVGGGKVGFGSISGEIDLLAHQPQKRNRCRADGNGDPKYGEDAAIRTCDRTQYHEPDRTQRVRQADCHAAAERAILRCDVLTHDDGKRNRREQSCAHQRDEHPRPDALL